MKAKELVTLRQKPTKGGGQSLFLDYWINGVRYKEYLRMYLVPEKTRLDKSINNDTLKTAMAIKAKRIVDIQNSQGGFKKPINGKDRLLTEFLKNQSDKYKDWGKDEYSKTIMKIATWVNKYKRINLRDVDAEYLEGFFRFLAKSGRSEGAIYQYYTTMRTLFNNAYKDNLIVESPFLKMQNNQKPKKPDTHREYLTLEELTKLMETPIKKDVVAKAFLFSCFTGLRISDIEALTWDKIRKTDKGYQVEATQQKTKRLVSVPLSENALRQLPPRPENEKKRVFDTLPTRTEIGRLLKNWCKKAGITKNISYHCSRHTCATLMLTYGVDIYTVSSILGHNNIETTQIYAKIVDAKRVEAINLVPTI